MADVFTEQERSNIMKKVHSSGNKSTELKLIKLMRENGITGWRRNYKVKDIQILYFFLKKSPFSSMVASGMDMTVATRSHHLIQITGKKNVNGIYVMTKKLLLYLKTEVGL